MSDGEMVQNQPTIMPRIGKEKQWCDLKRKERANNALLIQISARLKKNNCTVAIIFCKQKFAIYGFLS